MELTNIEFAIWVALFAAIASVISSIVSSLTQLFITNSNNKYLLKRAELEFNSNAKSKSNEATINSIKQAVNDLNTHAIKLTSGSFESKQRFWVAYYNAYTFASSETRIHLERFSESLGNQDITIQTIKSTQFSQLLNQINKSFCDDIMLLQEQCNTK